MWSCIALKDRKGQKERWATRTHRPVLLGALAQLAGVRQMSIHSCSPHLPLSCCHAHALHCAHCTAAARIGQTHALYEPCQWLQRMPKGSSLQMFTADIWHVLNCSCTGQSLLVTHTQSCSLPSLSLICSLFLQVFSFSGVSVHVTKDSRAHSIHAAFFWGFGTGRGTKREFKPFKSWRC